MKPDDLCKSGSEVGEQSALFCWANSKETRERFPHFYNAQTRRCKMFAIHNNAGVDGNAKTAAIRGSRAKQSGMQSGVADIFIPIARHGCHGLFVELKIDPNHPMNQRTGKRGTAIKSKAGTVSDDQAAFGGQVLADDFGWALCEGWQKARDVIAQYLSD